MATVAEKYPTPCTASFWTPDSDGQLQQPETVSNRPSGALTAATITNPAVIGAPERDSRGTGGGIGSEGSSALCPEPTADRGVSLGPVARW